MMTLTSKHGLTYETSGLIIKQWYRVQAGDVVLVTHDGVTDFDKVTRVYVDGRCRDTVWALISGGTFLPEYAGDGATFTVAV